MIPSTPAGMLSGGMKTIRSIGGKHQHLTLILTQLSVLGTLGRNSCAMSTNLPNLSELKQGIKAIWESLSNEICSRYIEHLKKVIPNVGPFGY